MTSDVPLDYAVFQLSPKRSRCELFVSYDGTTEKLASGLVKPFVTHLKVAEEQVALAVKSIKLEVERYRRAQTWFTKGTLERFVRFVSTPEVLEMVNTFDAEMSQLEAARRIYSQGAGDKNSSASGGDGTVANAASDATKKELLRAIDVRLAAVYQDLTTACSRAFAAGFNPETVSELQQFADRFGAHRLSEACTKFIDLSHRRPDLFHNHNKNNPTWGSSSDRALRTSTSSDMSLDDFDDQPKPSTCQQPTNANKHPPVTSFPLPRFTRDPGPTNEHDDRDHHIDKDNSQGPTTSTGTTTTSTTESESSAQTQSSSQIPQLTRRLSVQERINLFESKQKENSPSTATTPSSSATTTAAARKPELRRLSSDIAVPTDKAVLRRWSGASDMSIDVSGERKELDSNPNTPTPSSSVRLVFPPKCKGQSQGDLKAEEESKDKGKDSKPPLKGPESDEPTSSDSGGSSLNQPSAGWVQYRVASFGRAEEFGLENQGIPAQTQFRSRPGKSDQFGTADQTVSEEKVKGQPEGIRKDNRVSRRGIDGRSESQQGEAVDDGVRDQQVPRSTTVEGASESAASETNSRPLVQNKGLEAGRVPVGRKDSELIEKQGESHQMQMESSGLMRLNFQGHVPVSDQVRTPGGRSQDSGSVSGSSQPGLTGKVALEYQEVSSAMSLAPMDQVQRVRQSKGNPALNGELKMKANELEKLFAEHKLRLPGDQSNSGRRVKPVETPKEKEESSGTKKPPLEVPPPPLANTKMEAEQLNSTPSSKTADNQDYDVTPKQNIYSLGFFDDSKGKLYQKYMQKRDAKLREEWILKRAEKEAKLKAMKDSLEKSRAEMKATLTGSVDKRSYVHDARLRAEKLRSFNVRSATKMEQPVGSFISDEDEDQADFLRKKLGETFLEDRSSRSTHSKRVLPNKNTTSSTPRNTAAPVPRSSGKASNSASGRRKLQSENPLAQSVPNFSDLRKENTKPSSGGGKLVRPQARNHGRKKSTGDDLLLFNAEKPRRSNSLRKSTANPMELNDSHNSDDMDDMVFTSSKYKKEVTEDYDEFSKDMDSKAFPRKGNDAGRLVGSGIDRSQASLMVETVKNGYDYDDLSARDAELTDVPKGEEEDFETTVWRESTEMDNVKGRLSHESDKSANSGYENGSTFRRLSQADPALVSELPTSMPSLFHSLGSIHDSPGESPGSWTPRLPNPFSFSHEISDIDASDSPLGSPASWNFHTLAQNEAEAAAAAARMRKKWGATQKPIVGTDSSHSHSRKDVTRGLKRFLKFGRKNRASESLMDWISATTSEGDDDTEDGRDPASRSSEDLRKSRMGFSHSHHSDNGFNEGDLFNEQVQALQSSIPTPPANFKLREEHLSGSSLKAPKSFFSLSNFRSKGSDPKLR